jgi:hypothetical protein
MSNQQMGKTRDVWTLLKHCNPNHLILNETEAAELAALSVRGLQHRRLTGRGPSYLVIDRRVRYSAAAVFDWLETKTIKTV